MDAVPDCAKLIRPAPKGKLFWSCTVTINNPTSFDFERRQTFPYGPWHMRGKMRPTGLQAHKSMRPMVRPAEGLSSMNMSINH